MFSALVRLVNFGCAGEEEVVGGGEVRQPAPGVAVPEAAPRCPPSSGTHVLRAQVLAPMLAGD